MAGDRTVQPAGDGIRVRCLESSRGAGESQLREESHSGAAGLGILSQRRSVVGRTEWRRQKSLQYERRPVAASHWAGLATQPANRPAQRLWHLLRFAGRGLVRAGADGLLANDTDPGIIGQR